jgi:Tumour suppressor protein
MLLTLHSLASISSEYLNDILENLQSHMGKCATDITTEQNKLLSRCKYLDDIAVMVTKRMAQSLSHATVTAEKISQGK